MTKTELISAISKSADLSNTDASKALNAVIDIVTETLKLGDEVSITGFGTFSIGLRSERQGRNPQTGAAMTIKASRTARFKAGKVLRDAVQSDGTAA